MRWLSFEATASVAYKEFLHIYRDRRVRLLLLLVPPLFHLPFGHALAERELTHRARRSSSLSSPGIRRSDGVLGRLKYKTNRICLPTTCGQRSLFRRAGMRASRMAIRSSCCFTWMVGTS